MAISKSMLFVRRSRTVITSFVGLNHKDGPSCAALEEILDTAVKLTPSEDNDAVAIPELKEHPSQSGEEAREAPIDVPICLELKDVGDLTFDDINFFRDVDSASSNEDSTSSPTTCHEHCPSLSVSLKQLSPPSSSSSPSSPLLYAFTSPEVPRRIIRASDFQSLRLLGKGSQGKVILVKDKITSSRHALKVIKKGDGALNSCPRILSEQDIMRRLAVAGDPWFLKLEASFHDRESFFLLTEYSVRGDLRAEIARRKPMSPALLVQYSAEIIHILTLLHDRYHIIHRDFKPDNLLISQTGHLVIADFGISRLFRHAESDNDRIYVSSEMATEHAAEQENVDLKPEQRTPRLSTTANEQEVTQKICGSVGYMAPEIFTGLCYSYQVDVWAAGVTLYKMIFGKLPFGLNSKDNPKELYMKTCKSALQFEPIRGADVSPDTKDLLAQMLEKDALKRPFARELKSHPYFRSIDWDEIAARKNPGPGLKAQEPTRKNNRKLAAIPIGKPFEAADNPFPWFEWSSTDFQAQSRCRTIENTNYGSLCTEGKPGTALRKVKSWWGTKV